MMWKLLHLKLNINSHGVKFVNLKFFFIINFKLRFERIRNAECKKDCHEVRSENCFIIFIVIDWSL